MNEIEIVKNQNAEDMIHEVRGKQVILESDLAKLYGCETGNLNRARLRNINRFPREFSFQITKEEYIDLRVVNRNLPYVYTEQGVVMLSAVLHTNVAVSVSVRIINAFVTMRKYISNNIIEQQYINKMVLEDHENIKILQDSFNKLEQKTKINSIFFEGQIYDAYSLLIDILNESKEEIIIIDNYAGKELLDILKI